MTGLNRFREGRAWLVAFVVAGLLVTALPVSAQTPANINAALNAAYAKYKDLKEGANADYIPALAKVDSEHLRHRAGDGRRQGLHHRRHQLRGVDPVDLQGLHDGQGHGGAGPGRDREQHGRRRHRPGVQLDRRGRAVQGRRDERHGQPRRHHRDQHGEGRDAATRSGTRSSATTATSPGGRSSVNQEVFKSEAETNQRNQAIAMLMYAYGHIKDEPAAGERHLHRAVLGQRQRQGPGDDGGDARQRRQEPGDRQAGDEARRTCPRCWR